MQTQIKITTMRLMLILSIVLTAMKFLAYYITRSNAVLSDASESIINVIAGSFALYSIHYASRPKDENHPYGHGKIEYISAGFEGSLILITGFAIIGKAIYNFFHPQTIESLELGVYLTLFSGACNYFMGIYLVKKGKEYHSILMNADGKHLLADTYSSFALVIGLLVIHFTGFLYLDNVFAIFLGVFILSTGYSITKQSITGLLDEADQETINKMIGILNGNRQEKWIDMHNLRVLKYGSSLHVDCHITLPWYLSLEEAHTEFSAVETILNKNMEDRVEFFIHADPCLPISCPICTVKECTYRKAPFVKRLEWNNANLLPDKKHVLNS